MRESPVDRAFDLLVSNEPAAALRWSLAALEREPGAPRALFVTSRALARMGGARAAIDGLRLAARRAATTGDVPIAIAALGELRALGADVAGVADEIAATVCRDATSAMEAVVERTLPFAAQTHLRPISPAVSGRALISKATQMIYESASTDRRPTSPLAFFGGLSREAARDLILAFDTATVPAGHCLIEEGETTDCGFILACGGAEVWRRGTTPGDRRVLARLEGGALFGELALLVRLPSPASVVTTQGSMLLVAWHDAIEAVRVKHPDVRLELAAHCRRQAAANLGSALAVFDAVPLHERAALIERMDLRTFERGERLANLSNEAEGLHVIVSGEVLLVARDGSESVVLQTLAPGDTVGETELVLCRTANTEAIAVSDTATLFLPRDEFFALSRDYPAILHGLYAVASRRHAETAGALDGSAATVGDDCLVEEPSHEPASPPASERALESHTATVPPAPAPTPRASAPSVADEAPPIAHAPAPVTGEGVRSSVTHSHGPPPLSARVAVGLSTPGSSPSSVAPATISHGPPSPLPTVRGLLARRSVRATAVAAFAAGACAVLAPHADRRTLGAAPPPGSPAEGLVPPAAEPTPMPSSSPPLLARAEATPAPLSASASASSPPLAHATKPTTPSPTKHHSAAAPASPQASSEAPAASVASAPAVGSVERATTRPDNGSEFGGRE